MVTLKTWRERMSEDMRLRDFRPRTQEGYLLAVRQFIDRVAREPEAITDEDARKRNKTDLDATRRGAAAGPGSVAGIAWRRPEVAGTAFGSGAGARTGAFPGRRQTSPPGRVSSALLCSCLLLCRVSERPAAQSGSPGGRPPGPADRELSRLDEKLYFDVFGQTQKPGIVVFGTRLEVNHVIVDAIAGGRLTAAADVIDGVLASELSAVSLSDVDVTGCARAGLLFVDSDGEIAGAHVSRSRFGLVLQGERRPVVRDDCTFSDSAEQDRIDSGDLPIPDVPAPVP